MAGVLSKLFKRERADMQDAEKLYRAIMAQSRRTDFYGECQVPDTYDGRIDFLTYHMAIIMDALRGHGDNGSKLSQALYDVMIDDFDVALREEGLSDTGVVRRIKPMANLFFARVKSYTESLKDGASGLAETIAAGHSNDMGTGFANRLASYGLELKSNLEKVSLGEIARAKFTFPEFK